MNEVSAPAPTPAVVRSVVLPLPAAEAWRLVVDPTELGTWLGDDVELDTVVGGALRIVEDGVIRTGTVTEVDDGNRLGFTWAPSDADGSASSVTIEVAEVEDGAQITVTETPADGAPIACASLAGAWDGRLLDLELGALIAMPANAGLAADSWL